MKNLKKLIILTLSSLIFIFCFLLNSKTNSSYESIVNLKNVINIAKANGEDPNFTHHFCWPCENPYGQDTHIVACQDTGMPGCYWTECGYNYCNAV